MSNENYSRDPKDALEKVLEKCQWERIGPDLWEKSRSRLLIDHIGIFLFRAIGKVWVRTYGLSHTHINHLAERVIWFDKVVSINLETGE